ncbi:hypothetical protein [Streptomyces sp. 900116325]
MEGSAFSTQATFSARMDTADGMGSASLSFLVYADYMPEGVAPLRPEEVAGLLRDFYAPKGWIVSQFTGRPNDAPLDWPTPTDPEAS